MAAESEDQSAQGAPSWASEISKRLDAVERVQDALWEMLRDVLGRTSTGEPKIGEIGMPTKLVFVVYCLTPIAVALIATKPWA